MDRGGPFIFRELSYRRLLLGDFSDRCEDIFTTRPVRVYCERSQQKRNHRVIAEQTITNLYVSVNAKQTGDGMAFI
jgi:hypothetical protein